MAERGYEVVGSDLSPALIKIAYFDAVITIFNAIGHLTKEDFEQALKNIHVNLKDDGVYVFDIFNLQAIHDDMIDGFSMETENVVNDVKIRNVQHSEIDRRNGLLTSHDHYTIFKKGGEPEISTNSFSLQIYTAEELETLLCRNGFEIVRQYDMEGNDFVADKVLNILTVAKKKRSSNEGHGDQS